VGGQTRHQTPRHLRSRLESSRINGEQHVEPSQQLS
jgi:hypothetical protein